MRRPLDLTGVRSGMLTGIRRVGDNARGARQWEVRCDCGAAKVVTASNFGATKSCGCATGALKSASKRAHGMTDSPTYRSWAMMHARCRAPSFTEGGHARKGITVCERWASFGAFLADMGERPEGTSIDRIDNAGDYEPGNCRWATPAEQNTNRSDNLRLGHLIGLKAISEAVGTPVGTLEYAIYQRGWTLEHTAAFYAAKHGLSVSGAQG